MGVTWHCNGILGAGKADYPSSLMRPYSILRTVIAYHLHPHLRGHVNPLHGHVTPLHGLLRDLKTINKYCKIPLKVNESLACV